MQTVTLPSGEQVPALGQGTWYMGDDPDRRDEEIATLRRGLDLGLGLIDTAEMYGDGRSEELVAEAIRGRRDEVFLVSKVYPQNASRTEAITACERSLERLDTDRIDLYLLHWRGNVPLAQTMEAFRALQDDGRIRHYGVSNFDRGDMQDLWSVPGGDSAATDQVLYNLARRNAEAGLLPWLRERNVPAMAYSPFERSRLADDPQLVDFARRHERTPAQIALAWLLAAEDVIVIPKTGRRERLEENAGALEHPLTRDQLTELNRLYPAPAEPRPLEIR